MLNRHGVFSKSELSHLTPAELAEEVASQRLRRVGKSWYVAPTAVPEVVSAVAMGARVGCVSGCRLWGVWTPPACGQHVILPHRANRPTGSSVTFHRAEGSLPPFALFPLPDCLAQVLRFHNAETALMVLESAANQRLIPLSLATTLLEGAPVRRSTTLNLFDPRAESGTETRVRLFLQRRRVRVRPQVFVPGVGRVDLLVGESLIIECDSHAYHSDYREDRRRDLAARALGFQVLRLAFDQVMHDWIETQSLLIALIGTRRHLRAPSPL